MSKRLHYEWITGGDGQIETDWITEPPAPDKILSLMTCKCVRFCKGGSRQCIDNVLPCTSACRLLNCNNMLTDSDDLEIHPDVNGINDFDGD